jgi:hypothetical protein
MSSHLKICLLSVEIISEFKNFAILIAKSVFPQAVGQ